MTRPGRPVRRLGGHDPQGPRRRSRASVASSGPTAARSSPTAPAGARVRHPRAAPAGREGARSARPPRPSSSDGESIVMDASTTALSVARHLKARGGWSQLTVITNGLRLASELAGSPGDHRPDARRPRPLGGAVGRRPARRRPVRAGSTSRRRSSAPPGSPSSPGLADATDEEAQIKRSMVAAAREVIAIVDHTKWERAAFATFCPTDEIDVGPDRRRAPRRRWSRP